MAPRLHRLAFKLKAVTSRLFEAGLFNIFGADVINKILVFVSGMIVVRLIPQSTYGIYSYAYTILGIFLLFNGLGASSAVLQFASERAFSDRKESVELLGLCWGIAIDVILCLAMLVFPFFVELPVEGSGYLLRFWCLYPIFQLLFDIQLVSLRAALQNKRYSYSTNINNVFTLAFSVLGAVAGGALGLILGRTIAAILTVIVVALAFRVPTCLFSKNNIQVRLNGDERKSFIAIAITTAVNSAMNQLTLYLGTTLLGILLPDAVSVAIFQTTLAIPTALNFIPSTLVLFIYPYFARHKDEPSWVIRRYAQVICANAVLSAFIALVVSLFATPVITLLYGESYSTGADVLRILMIGWFFSSSFRTITTNLLVTQRKLIYGILVAIVSSAVLVASSYILIPQFGMQGAAWSQNIVSITAGIAYSAYFVVVVLRKLKHSLASDVN